MTRGLGTDYDLSIGAAPSDLHSGAVTGKRVSMEELDSVDIVLIKAAGTAGDDPTVNLKASTAASGGTTADLATIDSYNLKGAATLAGTETWTTESQSAAATIADPGGAGTSAEHQQICVIHVEATDMPEDKPYLSLNIASVATAAQIAAVLYIMHTQTKEQPADFPAPLR